MLTMEGNEVGLYLALHNTTIDTILLFDSTNRGAWERLYDHMVTWQGVVQSVCNGPLTTVHGSQDDGTRHPGTSPVTRHSTNLKATTNDMRDLHVIKPDTNVCFAQ